MKRRKKTENKPGKADDRQLVNFFSEGPAQGAGVRSRQGGPAFTWHRDLAHVLGPIMLNAAVMTETAFEDNKEARMDLNTILSMCHRIWMDCRTGGHGISGFSQLLQQLQKRKHGSEVLSAFSVFLLLNLYGFMFGSENIAVAAPNRLDEYSFSYSMFLSVLSTMKTKDRRRLIKAIQDAAVLPSDLRLQKLARPADDYLKAVEQEQKKLIAEGAAKRAHEESNHVEGLAETLLRLSREKALKSEKQAEQARASLIEEQRRVADIAEHEQLFLQAEAAFADLEERLTALVDAEAVRSGDAKALSNAAEVLRNMRRDVSGRTEKYTEKLKRLVDRVNQALGPKQPGKG